MSTDRKWYVHSKGSREGPITQEDVVARLRAHHFTPADFAWCEGMKTWQRIAELPELYIDPRKEVRAPPPFSGGPTSPSLPSISTAAPQPVVSQPVAAQVHPKMTESHDEISAIIQISPEKHVEEKTEFLDAKLLRRASDKAQAAKKMETQARPRSKVPIVIILIIGIIVLGGLIYVQFFSNSGAVK